MNYRQMEFTPDPQPPPQPPWLIWKLSKLWQQFRSNWRRRWKNFRFPDAETVFMDTLITLLVGGGMALVGFVVWDYATCDKAVYGPDTVSVCDTYIPISCGKNCTTTVCIHYHQEPARHCIQRNGKPVQE